MTCERVQQELVGYHFGLSPEESRAIVEAHLATCHDCVSAFIEVKRAIEIGEDAPLPSSAAQARRRRAVEAELGLGAEGAAASRWRWERPIAFAVAASFVLLAARATKVMTSGPGAPPHAIAERRAAR
jgi:anti-sigma factor RsiW